MSRECLKLYSKLNKKDIQTKLAIQCSPVIMGIKISNLIVVKKKDASKIFRLFRGTDISLFVLYIGKETASILLYRKELLRDYLQREEVFSTFEKLGYELGDLYKLLIEVRKRYTVHILKRCEFPHELGLILGYPLSDVVGFIKNQGKNYKLCGYWKVYDDEEYAYDLFCQFDRAKEKAVELLANDKSILELMEVS